MQQKGKEKHESVIEGARGYCGICSVFEGAEREVVFADIVFE